MAGTSRCNNTCAFANLDNLIISNAPLGILYFTKVQSHLDRCIIRIQNERTIRIGLKHFLKDSIIVRCIYTKHYIDVTGGTAKYGISVHGVFHGYGYGNSTW